MRRTRHTRNVTGSGKTCSTLITGSRIDCQLHKQNQTEADEKLAVFSMSYYTTHQGICLLEGYLKLWMMDDNDFFRSARAVDML